MPIELLQDDGDFDLKDFDKLGFDKSEIAQIYIDHFKTNQDHVSWFWDPTRALIFTLNYINEQLGLLMEIKLVV